MVGRGFSRVTPIKRGMNEKRAFWLAAADRYIDDCRRNGTVVRASELALRTGHTAVQLSREFQSAAGVHVKDYLFRRQVDLAKELLRTTSKSTAQIAAVTGFGTTRSFYRAFKRAAGVSPTAFRKEMSLEEENIRH